jgi:hypothetical protein
MAWEVLKIYDADSKIYLGDATKDRTFQLDNLSDGTHGYYVEVFDPYANKPIDTSETFTLTVNSNAPDRLVVSLENDTGLDNTDKITSDGKLKISGGETGATIEYATASSNWSDWSTNFTPVEGANNIQVRQTDTQGNVSGVTSFLFTFDIEAPASAITMASTSYDGQTFSGTWDGIDVGQGIYVPGKSAETLEISLDNGAHWQKVTDIINDTQWSYTSSGTVLNSGDTLLVRAVDLAGNEGKPVSQEITVIGVSGQDLAGTDGNDVIGVNSTDFKSVDGGEGFDVLKLTGSGLTLNLDHMKGIESIDLGTGNANTLNVSLQSVLDGLGGPSHALVVKGDAGDTVNLKESDGFVLDTEDNATSIIDGRIYDVYQAGSGNDVATLLLQQDLQVHQVP